MEVSIFIPCFIDQLYPQVAINMVQLLEKVGCTVVYEPNQTCCGQPAFNAGFLDPARQVAQKFLDDFGPTNLPIVCPSASCVGFIQNHFKSLLADHTQYTEQIENLAIYELTSFLVQQPKLGNLAISVPPQKILYHDSCAALRECYIKEEPRQLLQLIDGLEVHYPTDNSCCGFGGTFATKYEPISIAMGKKKVEEALALNVDGITSTDMSCLMHLEGYIKQQKLPLKVWHIAELFSNKKEANQ